MADPLPITNVSVVANRVFLNGRVQKGETMIWQVPAGNRFILTDLVVQNRTAGDVPVDATSYTRFTMSSPGPIMVVVGNNGLSEHFTTGWAILEHFVFNNMAVSTADLVEFVITGTLEHS